MFLSGDFILEFTLFLTSYQTYVIMYMILYNDNDPFFLIFPCCVVRITPKDPENIKYMKVLQTYIFLFPYLKAKKLPLVFF